jgi:ABC-type antimicrobial peptide transport system permease subunit
VLSGFLAVENTYLSTFQLLGGLGLLLGTLGLAAVMFRNTMDRRGELATLQAFGFPQRKISRLILIENTCLLLLGVALGTVSALLAVTPHLLQSAGDVPWTSLCGTLFAVVLAGVCASALSVQLALRQPLLPALKGQ